MTTAPASRRELNRRRTRARIYDAAVELLAEQAYADTSVEEICARAGVGRATFFRTFGAKAGLLTEFNRRLAVAITDEIDADPDRGAVARLRTVQRAVCATWASSGEGLREMAREWIRTSATLEFTNESPHPELLALVTDIVADGQAQGELRPGRDPELIAWLVVGVLSAVFAGWLGTGGVASLEAASSDALAVLLDGIAVRSAD